jgi:HlyD family secretion protein
MFKKKTIYIILAIIIIVGGAGAYWYASSDKTPIYVTETVKRGTLTQTVEATGKVESAERISLNFKTTGRIATMNVDSGDEVRQGQILATLEARALQSRVSDAQAQLDKAKADYDKLLAGASTQDVQVTEDTLEQKKQALIAAQNSLSNLKLKRDTELLNLKETALTTARNQVVAVQGSLQEIDITLANDDARDTLSIQNKDLILKAQTSRQNADDAAADTAQTLAFLTTGDSDQDVSAALEQTKKLIEQTNAALADTLAVLNATITSPDLTETELNTLKANIQNEQTGMGTARTTLQTARANWTNGIASYDTSVSGAQDDVDNAQAAIQVAQSQLGLKTSAPRQFEIDAQKAVIKQAEASVNLAVANLEEAIIRAPLSGIITKKFFEAGEQSSLSSPALEMIGRATLEIEVDIPESDIAKISIGQNAGITLDAFSDEQKFSGTVSFVDPAETNIQDVIYYKVKVQFESDNEQVKPGMTANVTIATATKDDVIFIPFRAVKSTNGDKYVEVLTDDGSPVQKMVTLGVRGDEGVEITSGLSEGEQVITFTPEN